MQTDQDRKTVELFVYICKGIAGAPANEYGISINFEKSDCKEKPIKTWSGVAYWALSMQDSPGYPDVFINIWYEGKMPSDHVRDTIHEGLHSMIGTVLFSQDPLCPRCKSYEIAQSWAIDQNAEGNFIVPEKVYICMDCGWEFKVTTHQ